MDHLWPSNNNILEKTVDNAEPMNKVWIRDCRTLTNVEGLILLGQGSSDRAQLLPFVAMRFVNILPAFAEHDTLKFTFKQTINESCLAEIYSASCPVTDDMESYEFICILPGALVLSAIMFFK
jgi:hypothetical protein